MDGKLLYTRKISAQLWLLRLICCAVALLSGYLFSRHIFDYAVFVPVLLIPFFILAPVRLSVYSSSVQVTTYSMFGFVSKTLVLNTTNIIGMTNHCEITEHSMANLLETDSAFDLLLFLLPAAKSTADTTVFEYADGTETRSLRLRLSPKEYRLAWDALNGLFK